MTIKNKSFEEINEKYDLEIEKIIGEEETSKMMESVKITNSELLNELKNIILNDKEFVENKMIRSHFLEIIKIIRGNEERYTKNNN